MARLGRKVQLMQVSRCQWARLAGLLGWGTWLVCFITWEYTWKRKMCVVLQHLKINMSISRSYSYIICAGHTTSHVPLLNVWLLTHLYVTIQAKSRRDCSWRMKYLVPEGPQVLAGLQDALDDGNRVCESLHLLQWVENSHRFILQTGVTLLPLHCAQKASKGK